MPSQLLGQACLRWPAHPWRYHPRSARCLQGLSRMQYMPQVVSPVSHGFLPSQGVDEDRLVDASPFRVGVLSLSFVMMRGKGKVK
jgi:hypothetical protein